MRLLASKLYDPGAAVSKSAASLLAMTALDTTNLRNTFTVPSHGMVRVRMRGVVHGGSAMPGLLMGVMNGSTVVGRVPAVAPGFANANAYNTLDADFTIAGLTPGSVSWDAAYGVEFVSASSAIKYGGPDNTTGADAFGGFLFEVWDPAPQPTNFSLMAIDASGNVAADLIEIAGAAVNTAQAQLGVNLVSGAAGAITAGVIAADAIGASELAADAIAEIQSGLATAAALATVEGKVDVIDDLIDTEVAAIKTKTDQLTFTSGNVNANAKAVNDTALTGNGSTTPWGPA